MNKKGIGFGVWLVLITFVLFTLIIASSIRTHNATQQSLGTWGSDYITNYPLETNRFFADTMNFAVGRSIRDLAKDSFVDRTNLDCASNSDATITEGIIILDENCKPNKGYIKGKVAQDVANYFKESSDNYAAKYNLNLYQIDLSSTTCQFGGDNGDILTCVSGQQNISYEKKTPYFTYIISRSFIINQSVNLSEILNLDEIEKLNKQHPEQPMFFDKWEKAGDVQEDETHYNVFLKSKENLFNLDTYTLEPVLLSFSLRKTSSN